MGGKSGLDKGKRAEREVVKLLQAVIDEVCEIKEIEPIKLERNLLQANKGGYDIFGLDWLALEVKHQETFNLNQWWKQAKDQAKEDQIPVLMYRKNNVKFRVRMYGWLPLSYSNLNGKGKWALVDIALDDFLEWFRFKLYEEVS